MRYPTGQPVRITWTVKDVGGAPVNPTAQTLTLLKPDLTTSPYTSPGTTGTGLFYQDVPVSDLPLTGHYQWKVVSTGTGAGATSGAFDVYDPFDAELLSLDDAKQHLNITSNAQDAELELYVAAVTDAIEAYVGPCSRRTFTETVQGGRELILSRTPVISLTSVTAVYPGGPAYDVAGVTVDPVSGVVRQTRVQGGYSAYTGPVVVVYVAGRTTVPAAVQMAARLVLERLWETQRGGTTSPQIIGSASADGTGVDAAFSYVKSYGVRELLDPYRLPPAVA